MVKQFHRIEVSDQDGQVFRITFTPDDKGNTSIEAEPGLGVEQRVVLADLLIGAWHVAGANGDNLLAACILPLAETVIQELESVQRRQKKQRRKSRKDKPAASGSGVSDNDTGIPF